jgi:ABC-type molybdate transport system substrate-binding protein
MILVIRLLVIAAIIVAGCKNRGSVKPKEIIIFNAGSLSVQVKQFTDEYGNDTI